MNCPIAYTIDTYRCKCYLLCLLTQLQQCDIPVSQIQSWWNRFLPIFIECSSSLRFRRLTACMIDRQNAIEHSDFFGLRRNTPVRRSPLKFYTILLRFSEGVWFKTDTLSYCVFYLSGRFSWFVRSVVCVHTQHVWCRKTATFRIYTIHISSVCCGLYIYRMYLNGTKDWPFKSIKLYVSTAHGMSSVCMQSILWGDVLCVSLLQDVPNR